MGKEDSSKHGLVVEFLGLPRAGKSTLSHRVAEILASRGLSVDEPAYRVAHELGRPRRSIRKGMAFVTGVITEPRRVAGSLRVIRASHQRSRADYLKNLLNWVFVSHLIRERTGHNQVRLLDQGIFQAIWSVLLSAGNANLADLADAAMRVAPSPAMVVMLEASEPRRAARSGGPSRVHADPGRYSGEAAASTYREVKAAVRRHAEGSDRLRAIAADNDDDDGLERNAAAIADEIRATLEEGRTGWAEL